MTCCFFGHGTCPSDIRPKVKIQIERMMTEFDKVTFYVGDHGQFDKMVRGVMNELISEGKSVDYSVVLAYMPCQKHEFDAPDRYSDTICPDGIDTVPPRFAICRLKRVEPRTP